MSCSSVNIVGSGEPVTKTPHGSPLLIANLQFDPSKKASEDEFWASCHTDDPSSILYPPDFGGINGFERDPSALNLSPFRSEDVLVCASDNTGTVNGLRLNNIGGRQSQPQNTAAGCGTTALGARGVSACAVDDSSRLEITVAVVETEADMDVGENVNLDVDLDVAIEDVQSKASEAVWIQSVRLHRANPPRPH